MKQVIQDKLYDMITQLNQNGYIIVDFLDNQKLIEINEYLLSISENIYPYFSNGIHMTTWIDNVDLKLIIKDKLNDLISKECNSFFYDFKLLNTTLIIKNKHHVSNFPLHQDWSFVDETKNVALNLWIALQDTNEKNGGLYVIKGTHKLNNYIRGSGKLFSSFEEYGKKLNKYITPIKLKAGQAVLFHYSLIHGSVPNLSNQSRIVVSTTVLPKDAEIIINYYDEINSELKQFKMEDDFIYNYKDIKKESNLIPTGGKLINTIKNYIPKQVAMNDINKVALYERGMFFRRFINKYLSLHF